MKGNAPVEIEILAHSLQFERANDTAKLALAWLKQTPRNPSNPDRFLQFLDTVVLTQPASPKPMLLNRLRESWRQPWTCSLFLYRALEAIARRRDWNVQGKLYEEDAGAFYRHLKDLESRLAKARGLGASDKISSGGAA